MRSNEIIRFMRLGLSQDGAGSPCKVEHKHDGEMHGYSLNKIYKETYHGFEKYKTETQPNRPIK